MLAPDSIKNLFPKVINKRLQKTKFRPTKIMRSLMKETNIPFEDVVEITTEVCRYVIASNFRVVTPPELREVICKFLIDFGYELERYNYTRLGYPYRDFENLYNHKDEKQIIPSIQKTEDLIDQVILKSKLYKRMVSEFEGINQIKSDLLKKKSE